MLDTARFYLPPYGRRKSRRGPRVAGFVTNLACGVVLGTIYQVYYHSSTYMVAAYVAGAKTNVLLQLPLRLHDVQLLPRPRRSALQTEVLLP